MLQAVGTAQTQVHMHHKIGSTTLHESYDQSSKRRNLQAVTVHGQDVAMAPMTSMDAPALFRCVLFPTWPNSR